MEYLKDKIIALLVLNNLEGLNKTMEDLIRNGYSVIEVTLRTDCAFEAIRYLKKNYPDLIVGAGTILNVEQLQSCIDCGADFGVAPGLSPEVVKYAQAQSFDFVPGIATASELEQAISFGLDMVKVFPAKYCGGPGFIKALSGPYSHIKFMPTGGITEETAQEYMDIPSVYCVGGSWMAR